MPLWALLIWQATQSALPGLIGTIIAIGTPLGAILGWLYHLHMKSMKDYLHTEMQRTRVYHYNTMTTMFRILVKLHPDKTSIINDAMLEFMLHASVDKPNGKARGASNCQ